MASKLRVSGIVEESITDGEGLRFVIFTQGCTHHCSGCHNPQTHAMDGGHWMEISVLAARILENPLLDGVTFSGGEPFLQAEALAVLGRTVKKHGLDIVTYTGYTYEALQKMKHIRPDIQALLHATDILIDGPYIQEQKDLALAYRGSKNQRIIRLHAGMKAEPF
ncbi:MAG: anaerobic ribonucleoside-triphosphate reductase activating protein [Christensenellales bacterium]|jgi:anaerobic ribonucleoside-triphosphate reductase activating protein